MFIPAFAGQSINPQAGLPSVLWSGLFCHLWWKRRARRGWHVALIGIGLGILVFAFAAFVGGFVRRAAGT
jgi:hypothetical protein